MEEEGIGDMGDRGVDVVPLDAERADDSEDEERDLNLPKLNILLAASKATPTEDSSDATDEDTSLQDSSDNSLSLYENSFGLGLPLEEPAVDSWVGVKIEKYASTRMGRKIKPFEVYIARVIDCGDDGFGVSLIKEKSEGFYTTTKPCEVLPS